MNIMMPSAWHSWYFLKFCSCFPSFCLICFEFWAFWFSFVLNCCVWFLVSFLLFFNPWICNHSKSFKWSFLHRSLAGWSCDGFGNWPLNVPCCCLEEGFLAWSGASVWGDPTGRMWWAFRSGSIITWKYLRYFDMSLRVETVRLQFRGLKRSQG